MAFSDIFIYGFTLFTLGIIVITGYAMFNQMLSPDLGEYSLLTNYTSPDGTITVSPAAVGYQFFKAIDWIIIFIAVIYAIGMFIAGWILPSHPIFTFISVLTLLIWLVIAPFFRNVYLLILQLPVLSGAAEAFPLTTTLMMNLPLVGFIVGVLAAIATHGKSNNPQGGAPF